MKNIAIYGFGGLGKEVACLINHINAEEKQWHLIGFIDDGIAVGTENTYGRVLGGLDYVNAYPEELNLVMAIGSPRTVKKIVAAITNCKISYPNIVATNALFFDRDSVVFGQGNIVTFSCRISCCVKIGNFNIFNGSVSIGHDVSIGDFNVFLPDCRISGGVGLGDLIFLGARSFIYQNVKIGRNVKISAGSFITRSTEDNALYAGNPARNIDINF